MYECVKHGVEFVLAGSIRDDGPLPETVMDLVEAQERYAAALSKNVQLVLMLSSMLHSIGVGNMLPSWVRVVCVDINPAVVTKLSDRGSHADGRRRHRRRTVPAPAGRGAGLKRSAPRRFKPFLFPVTRIDSKIILARRSQITEAVRPDGNQNARGRTSTRLATPVSTVNRNLNITL